jgi:hypothetical protein
MQLYPVLRPVGDLEPAKRPLAGEAAIPMAGDERVFHLVPRRRLGLLNTSGFAPKVS